MKADTCFFKILLGIISGYLLSGCDRCETRIKQYESAHHRVKVEKMINLDTYELVTAADSIYVLQNQYDVLLSNRIKSLDRQKDSIQTLMDKALVDLTQTDNPLMKKALKDGIASLNLKQKKISALSDLYRFNPEKTGLIRLLNEIDRYSKKPESILGYKLQVRFLGQQGLLPIDTFNRTYLFDLNKKQIRGLLQ